MSCDRPSGRGRTRHIADAIRDLRADIGGGSIRPDGRWPAQAGAWGLLEDHPTGDEEPSGPSPDRSAGSGRPVRVSEHRTVPLPPPDERCGVRLELPYELASSHWVALLLPASTRGTDFLTLTFLLLHARRLGYDDLALLRELGFATADDYGRLYVRVSDLGLSIETGLRRQTVARSIARLARCGLVGVHRLPQGVGGYRGAPFVDSRGTYSGKKLYLLARELEDVFDLRRASSAVPSP